MSTSLPVRQLQFDASATYVIRVFGSVALSWSDRLLGMAISIGTSPSGMQVTTLMGELPNQAALATVLNALYDMQATLFSVECLTCSQPNSNSHAG